MSEKTLYVVADSTNDRIVKIGIAGDVAHRLRTFSKLHRQITGRNADYVALATSQTPCDRTLEAEVHRVFIPFRLMSGGRWNSEWFRFVPLIRDFADRLRRGEPVAQALRGMEYRAGQTVNTRYKRARRREQKAAA